MARILTRGHKRFLLAAFLLSAVFLPLWCHASKRGSSRGRWHQFILETTLPLQKVSGWTLHLPERLLEATKEWTTLKSEKERLDSELRDANLELIRLKGLEAELRSLEDSMKLLPTQPRGARPARLVAADTSTWNRSFVIDAGSADGVSGDAPVLSAQGVVGRVWSVSEHASRVLSLLDPSSGAAGIVVRSRVKGVVRGTGRNRLRYDYVDAGADVEPGDLVVTSGLGGVFPRNIPLGTVVRKVAASNGLTLDIELAPAVDFGALEHVFVVPPTPTDRK